jgi:type III pantothenate kinase
LILLLDIGNTHTHLGLANSERVLRRRDVPTQAWFEGNAEAQVAAFVGSRTLQGSALCSVVPRVTPLAHEFIRTTWELSARELTARTARGMGIRYPKPATIGADRLANALAARHHFGTPVVAVDFGTAVTFDVVDERGDFIGGIIAPGLEALADYLHARTAQLPKIRVRPLRRYVGRSTEEAMRIAVVQGYRGLVRELIGGLKRELGRRDLRVVATGGYARFMAAQVPDIAQVMPDLTLEGLRLFWLSCGEAAEQTVGTTKNPA